MEDSNSSLNASAQQHEISDCESSSSSSSDEEVDIEEKVQLSDTVIMYPNQKLTKHRQVVAGEICSRFESRPCVIKFDPDQIINETKALLKLGCHSNMVGLIENGTHREMFSDTQYIVLEKYHKLNLEDYVQSQNTEGLPVYDVRRGVQFCKQIINGMKFVHEKLIIHKDLKPSNILLCHDLENIRIADFGSSQEVKSFSSMVPCPCTFGTLGYRPPESLDRSFVSLKSDVYSLAVVFCFLLSKGKSPFGPDSDKWEYNTQNCVIDISNLLVSNPLATKHLIWSMLNKERCRRPSIHQVADHPCWSGEECDVDFEYGFENEVNDSEIVEEVKPKQEYDVSKDEFIRILKYLDKMHPKSVSVKSQRTPKGIFEFGGTSNKSKQQQSWSFDVMAEGGVDQRTAMFAEGSAVSQTIEGENINVVAGDQIEGDQRRPPQEFLAGRTAMLAEGEHVDQRFTNCNVNVVAGDQIHVDHNVQIHVDQKIQYIQHINRGQTYSDGEADGSSSRNINSVITGVLTSGSGVLNIPQFTTVPVQGSTQLPTHTTSSTAIGIHNEGNMTQHNQNCTTNIYGGPPQANPPKIDMAGEAISEIPPLTSSDLAPQNALPRAIQTITGSVIASDGGVVNIHNYTPPPRQSPTDANKGLEGTSSPGTSGISAAGSEESPQTVQVVKQPGVDTQMTNEAIETPFGINPA